MKVSSIQVKKIVTENNKRQNNFLLYIHKYFYMNNKCQKYTTEYKRIILAINLYK